MTDSNKKGPTPEDKIRAKAYLGGLTVGIVSIILAYECTSNQIPKYTNTLLSWKGKAIQEPFIHPNKLEVELVNGDLNGELETVMVIDDSLYALIKDSTGTPYLRKYKASHKISIE